MKGARRSMQISERADKQMAKYSTRQFHMTSIKSVQPPVPPPRLCHHHRHLLRHHICHHHQRCSHESTDTIQFSQLTTFLRLKTFFACERRGWHSSEGSPMRATPHAKDRGRIVGLLALLNENSLLRDNGRVMQKRTSMYP